MEGRGRGDGLVQRCRLWGGMRRRSPIAAGGEWEESVVGRRGGETGFCKNGGWVIGGCIWGCVMKERKQK